MGRPAVFLAATLFQWLIFLHLTGAALFVAGAVVAGAAQLGALGRERPSEIAALLRLARYGVLLVAVGSLTALGFGLGLVADLHDSYGDGWIAASLGLWLASQGLGGAGGRTARHARERAERLAAAGDEPDAELSALVAHRPSLVLSSLSTAALVAILALMIWKPGS
jgi:uncharacterized membrane protein